MIPKLINLFIFAGLAIIFWIIDLRYANIELEKLFYTFLTISILYLVLKFFLEAVVASRIRDSKNRYAFRKIVGLLFIILSIIAILRIWVVNPEALLVAYGLVAAGVAISLQDIFKNFAGAISIQLTNLYRAGDRIQIDTKYGDVIDVGIFYTSLLEIREWIDGDQATGRIVMVPNGQVLSKPVCNYTKDHNFIWDELSIPITYDSDWKSAVDTIEELVNKTTISTEKEAEREISKLEEKYYLSKRNIEAKVFVTPTDNWIMLKVRYVVGVRERRLINNKMYGLILEQIGKLENVKIASETLTITKDNLE